MVLHVLQKKDDKERSFFPANQEEKIHSLKRRSVSTDSAPQLNLINLISNGGSVDYKSDTSIPFHKNRP